MPNDILGSPTALSLASSTDLPMTVAGLAVGGVIMTVTAAVFVYKEYELFQEKKQRKAIEEINRLHKRFLAKIVIPGYNEIQGFPPLFKLTTNENSSTADSMHFTDDEIRDMLKNVPHSSDIALAPYWQSVYNAILKLIEYYFSREDHHDLTAGVISYLLYMLCTKCLNFQGYDYDIAYLEAITQFIDAYASLGGEVNSQHFTRLQPVYSYLLSAKKYLEKHRESLSLEELLAELRDCCANTSNKLLRHLVKMTIDQSHVALADTVTLDELQNNILRRHYVSSQIKGIELFADSEINLPECIFKEWIMSLSQYYIKSLRPISSIRENSIVAPDILFQFVPWAKSLLSESDLSKIDEEALKQLDKSLEEICAVFKNAPNFLNTQLDLTGKKPRFISITEPNEVVNRTAMMSQFARLIHSIISMQYLCAHLLKSIKQLGDIYAKDRNHFCEIFGVLSQLMLVIKNGVALNLSDFSDIEKANQNIMRLEKEALFSREIVSTLNSVKQMTTKLGTEIIEYRNKASKPSDPTEDSITYEMRAVANLLSKMYPETVQQDTCCTQKTIPKIPVDTDVQKPESESKNSLPAAELPSQETQSVHLHKLTSLIFNQIRQMQQEPIADMHINQYLTIYRNLNTLQAKSIALLNEPNKTIQRAEKAQKTADLILSLCQRTFDFLSLPKEERLSTATEFVQRIHNELNHPVNNSFIDKHSNSASQFIYTNLCSFGLFQTETRRKMSQLDEDCKALVVSSRVS